ncbi:MAG: protein kinase [Gemmatimonadetes bacterium]|nr:protein kinase [Gemmatimonadota bacterium]
MTAGGERGLELRLAGALGSAYTIEGEIGRGGMGVVYRAKDERLKRPVAVKVLPPELAYRTDIRARFMREAETAARLSHPNIVPIHTVGDANDLVYFILGLVDGESLAVRLKRRSRLSVDEARRIMRETADALAAAHQQGVIHRDVKPDNILLEGTRGRVMVTDFGIAKALSAEGATLTEAGVAIGTPAFMSPEQAAGERELDGRSDLYSLGVVAYQMLTGELPFQAPTVPALLMKQITEMPTPVERKRPETPRELSQIVMRCLEKDPEDRWPTADALRRALETNTYTAPPPRAPTRRRPAAAADPLDSLGGALDAGRRALGHAEERAGRALQRAEPLSRRPSRRAERQQRRLQDKEKEEREIEARARQRGEPVMVAKFRHRLATYAAANGMLVLLNIATTGLDTPWVLFPIVFWGWGLSKDFAKLWTSGYSWRDVIHRPPAPDAVGARSTRTGLLEPPTPDEFGAHAAGIEQARSDRAAVLAMLERLPKSERKLLPEIAPTVDQLLERAADLARTLSALERDIDTGSVEKLEARIAALEQEPPSGDKERRLTLLEQQRRKVGQLMARQNALASQLESCLLAMQNVRFDLLRLRSAGVAEALGDLTAATQQARALSRDVDAAIMAASEVRRITDRDANLTRD